MTKSTKDKSLKLTNFMINGFIFPQQLLDDIRFYNTESFRPLTSAAVTVLLALLSKCDDRGIVKEFSLTEWSKSLVIAYSTLHSGMARLEEGIFIKEIILESGKPAIQIVNYDKYREPEKHNDTQLNYFRVPRKLFKTNILKKLVHTSCVNGILFLLQLLNQFRTKLAKMSIKDIKHALQKYSMPKLKELISPSAKKVRDTLQLIQPLFIPASKQVEKRGEGEREQVRLKSVTFTICEEIVMEKEDEFETDSLIAQCRKELNYILSRNGFYFNNQDLYDVMNGFEQEVVHLIRYIDDLPKRNMFIKNVFYGVLDGFELQAKEMKADGNDFTFKNSIGGYFRISFRKFLDGYLLRYFTKDLLHQAIHREYKVIGTPPKLLERIGNLQ